MKSSLLHTAKSEAERAAKALPVVGTRRARPAPKTGLLDIDKICADICETKSMREIAAANNIDMATLLEWIEGDPHRVARTREARRRTALLWEERAEAVLAQAGDNFELQKARELAHHYRWRAKMIAPKEYGDKVTQELTGKDGAPIAVAQAVNFKALSDKELEAMQAMLAKAVKPAGDDVVDVEVKELKP